MSEFTTEQKLARHANAAEFIARYEADYGAPLPQVWQSTITKLLLQGLQDHQVHDIYSAIAQVEHASGRLAAPPQDYTGFGE